MQGIEQTVPCSYAFKIDFPIAGFFAEAAFRNKDGGSLPNDFAELGSKFVFVGGRVKVERVHDVFKIHRVFSGVLNFAVIVGRSD